MAPLFSIIIPSRDCYSIHVYTLMVGGKQKVKKHPGLTDLKVQRDTPRTRLEKKILSKRALKRVAESVDTANAKKYMDKFGYNFNYALGK